MVLPAGTLEMPALFAVHESAPDDPSIPLQEPYPQPPDSCSSQSSPFKPPDSPIKARMSQSSAANPREQNTDRHSQQHKPSDADTDTDSAAEEEAQSSNGKSRQSWKPRSARLSALRQGQKRTTRHISLSETAKGVPVAEGLEASIQAVPRVWYTKQEDAAGVGHTSSIQGQQVTQTALKQQQQQYATGRVEAESDSSDLSTGGIDSSTQRTAKGRQSVESPLQQLGGDAHDQHQHTDVYLPGFDLLAQFALPGSIEPQDLHHNMAAAYPAEGDAVDEQAQHVSQVSVDEGDERQSEMVVNLNGAQVLTPEGWQSVPSRLEPGTAWEQGNCLTIGMTLQYQMCAESGKIVAATCGWATIDAYAWSVQDMLDMYVTCTGLRDL